jgi:peptidoglycan hydrolase-like protein with peptidoglycan-binding domain
MDEEIITPEEAPEVVEEVFTAEEFFEHLDQIDAEAEAEAVVVEEVEEVVAPKPKPAKPKPVETTPTSTSVPPTTYAVVGGGKTDGVYLSRALYKNMNQKRSLTVHHIQRRLKEWGFKDAYSDRDGFYGDRTKKSVSQFQEYLGLEMTGLMDAETMTRLFEGDTNVTVQLS